MAHRLVLCFDGTWDRPDPNTDVTDRIESNVCRFYESVEKRQDAGRLRTAEMVRYWRRDQLVRPNDGRCVRTGTRSEDQRRVSVVSRQLP